MAVEVGIDNAANIAVFRLSGAMLADAVCSAIDELTAHPDFTPGMNVMVVFQKGCDTRFSVVDTMRVVDYATSRVAQLGSGYRLALVVSSASDFGLARTYQVWSKALPRDARVFHSLPEARAWVSAVMPVSGVRVRRFGPLRPAATRKR